MECGQLGRGLPAAALPRRRPDASIEQGKYASENTEDLIDLQLSSVYKSNKPTC